MHLTHETQTSKLSNAHLCRAHRSAVPQQGKSTKRCRSVFNAQHLDQARLRFCKLCVPDPVERGIRADPLPRALQILSRNWRSPPSQLAVLTARFCCLNFPHQAVDKPVDTVKQVDTYCRCPDVGRETTFESWLDEPPGLFFVKHIQPA